MSEMMGGEIKRWTARRKSALILESSQGRDNGGCCWASFRPDPD